MALALARNVQSELRRVGCDPGSTDGKWSGKAKDALREFRRLAKVSLPSDDPTEEALSALKDKQARICPLRCAADQTEVNGKCIAKAKSEPAKKTFSGQDNAEDAAEKAKRERCATLRYWNCP
jgi:hypothetical protein